MSHYENGMDTLLAVSDALFNEASNLFCSAHKLQDRIDRFLEAVESMADDNSANSGLNAMLGLLRINLESAKSHVEIASQLLESTKIDVANCSALIKDYVGEGRVNVR